MRIVALLQLLIANPAFAQDSPLIGNWKLVAFQIILDNDPPKDWSGARPKGYLILTREGRMAAVISGETRTPAKTDAERAELWKSMLAYSGRYRVEGKEFVTAVDVSWNENWNGTEQRRSWRIEDGKLIIDAGPEPSPRYPGRAVIGRLIWEPDK